MGCLVAFAFWCLCYLLYVISREIVVTVICGVIATRHERSLPLSPPRNIVIMRRISVRWCGRRRINQRAVSSRRSLETILGYRAGASMCAERHSKRMPYKHSRGRNNCCKREKVIDVSAIEETLVALSSRPYSAPNTAWGATEKQPRSRMTSGALQCGARRMLRLDRELRAACTPCQVRRVLRAQAKLYEKYDRWPRHDCVMCVKLPQVPRPLRMCLWQADIHADCVTPSAIERALFEVYPTALTNYDRVSVVNGMCVMPHREVLPHWPMELNVIPDVRQGTNNSLPADYDE
eukprot:1444392-Amphidinium_carterae.1